MALCVVTFGEGGGGRGEGALRATLPSQKSRGSLTALDSIGGSRAAKQGYRTCLSPPPVLTSQAQAHAGPASLTPRLTPGIPKARSSLVICSPSICRARTSRPCSKKSSEEKTAAQLYII